MFKVGNNNIITMTRADTVSFNVEINQGTTAHPINYKLRKGDKVYFGLCEYNKKFEHAILKKFFTEKDVNEDGTVTIKIESDETVNLIPGTYFYEIKLEKLVYAGIVENKTEVSTIVPRTKFIILD